MGIKKISNFILEPVKPFFYALCLILFSFLGAILLAGVVVLFSLIVSFVLFWTFWFNLPLWIGIIWLTIIAWIIAKITLELTREDVKDV